MSNIKRFVFSNLGHCPKCMRTSFLVALLSSLAAAVLVFLFPRVWIFAVVFLGALWALWMAHIVVFAIKFSGGAEEDFPVNTRRRAMLARFGKAASFAAVATALPAAAQSDPYWCGSDPYSDQRNGFGACGQFCRRANGEHFDCPKRTRPVYLKNGECTCCVFRECS